MSLRRIWLDIWIGTAAGVLCEDGIVDCTSAAGFWLLAELVVNVLVFQLGVFGAPESERSGELVGKLFVALAQIAFARLLARFF